ncbi:MAG: ImmA/IrrE family metallo-endopeptidase [Myxococcota bacterium]
MVAERLLDRYAITEPNHLDVDALVEAEGVAVVRKEMEGAEGRLVLGRKGARIVVNKDLKQVGKARFVVAHEFGHYLQESRTSQAHLITDTSLVSLYQSDPQETAANIFAAELLMPERWLRSLIDGKQPSFRLVKSIAESLSTTLTATTIRYLSLTKEPAALVVAKEGRISWSKPASSGWYYRLRGNDSELRKSTCAYDLFQGRAEEPNPTAVDAEGWLEMENLKPDAEIYEHSIMLGNYGITLTLLWIDKDPTYFRRVR